MKRINLMNIKALIKEKKIESNITKIFTDNNYLFEISNDLLKEFDSLYLESEEVFFLYLDDYFLMKIESESELNFLKSSNIKNIYDEKGKFALVHKDIQSYLRNIYYPKFNSRFEAKDDFYVIHNLPDFLVKKKYKDIHLIVDDNNKVYYGYDKDDNIVSFNILIIYCNLYGLEIVPHKIENVKESQIEDFLEQNKGIIRSLYNHEINYDNR